MTFTPPDILILIILGFFTFSGFKNGFIKEAARISGMVGGFFTAHKFHDDHAIFRNLYLKSKYSYRGIIFRCILHYIDNY